MCPKITPPTGRATKPIAKVSSDRIVPTTGSKVGKKSSWNTSADAVP
jgi:hypothetical protein